MSNPDASGSPQSNDEPTKRGTRSPAQIEASRRNGAKSSGPKTAAGKHKSSHNALKSGLYAETLQATADTRIDRAEKFKNMQELCARYDDGSRMAERLIQTIVSDTAAQARYQAQRDVLSVPPGHHETEQRLQEALNLLRQAESRLESAEALGRTLEQGLDPDKLERAAERLQDLIAWSRQSNPSVDPVLVGLAERCGLGPDAPSATTGDHDKSSDAIDDPERCLGVFQEVSKTLQHEVDTFKDEVTAINNEIEEQNQLTPETLNKLDQYERQITRIDRRIDGSLARLQRDHGNPAPATPAPLKVSCTTGPAKKRTQG